MGQNEEAEKEYILALEADPNNAVSHTNYGNFLLQMERGEEAEKQYQLALNIDPKNAAAHNNYGVLLERMGNKDEARKQYQLALEADPTILQHTTIMEIFYLKRDAMKKLKNIICLLCQLIP